MPICTISFMSVMGGPIHASNPDLDIRSAATYIKLAGLDSTGVAPIEIPQWNCEKEVRNDTSGSGYWSSPSTNRLPA